MTKPYTLTRGWKQEYIGGNGQICYGIQLSDPQHKPQSGRQNPFGVNDWTFRNRREELIEKVEEMTPEKYDELLAELNKLPQFIDELLNPKLTN